MVLLTTDEVAKIHGRFDDIETKLGKLDKLDKLDDIETILKKIEGHLNPNKQ